MINTSKMTVSEFRNLYNDEGNEDSGRLLNKIVKMRKSVDNKSAFDGFLMVLIGRQSPGRRYCEISVTEDITPNWKSISNSFIQNGNRFWNYKKNDDFYYNLLFGDKVSAKDGRTMSDKMQSFIEEDENLECTIDECYRDLIWKIKNSAFSTADDRQRQVEKVKNCYDQFHSTVEPAEGKEMKDISIEKTNFLHKKLEKLIENGVHQIILTGAPGTGKTFSSQKFAENFSRAGEIDGKKYAFVQFHSSYDYTDFVEGLRPAQVEGGKTEFVKIDGIFKRFCRKVVEENMNKETMINNKNYFFIIDEINRADLSRVFGELMYGLEENYRDKRFDTQYSNLPTYEIINKKAVPMEEDIFENGFFIPRNVYIIGTMNDIDRSVEAFDFALRRRFQWIEVKANDIMKDALEEMQTNKQIHSDIDLIKLEESVKTLNKVISGDEGKRLGLSDAYHIGPAYLKTKATDTLEAKKEIWEYRIEPILKEYCRGYNDTDHFIDNCKLVFLGVKNVKE